MIADKKIKLISVTSEYNPRTSAVESVENVLSETYANVTNMSAQRTLELFGELIRGVKVIRLTKPVHDEFTQVEIDGKRYFLNSILTSRDRSTMIVKEVK